MPRAKDLISRPEECGGSWWCGLDRAEFAARIAGEAARKSIGNPASIPGNLTDICSPRQETSDRKSGTRVPGRLDLGCGFGPMGFGYYQTSAYFTGHQALDDFVPPSLK